MAHKLVKSLLQRLDSLLLREKKAFAGLEDQIERIVNKLRELAGFSDGSSGTEDVGFGTWENELKDFIDDVENRIEEFIRQINKQQGSDPITLSSSIRNEMQMIESRVAETIHRMTQASSSTAVQGKMEEKNSQGSNKGQSSASSSVSFESNFINLPDELQNCLLYCCIFPENYWIAKGKLIRLLVAENLIKEKAGKVMEDIAEENIYELVNQGMLHITNEQTGVGTGLQVPTPHREFCLHRIEKGNFRSSSPNSDSSNPQLARCVVTNSDLLEIENLPLQSLFLIGNKKSFQEKDSWLKLRGTKFLRVLDLENTKMKSLPDEVQDMIHLTYLGLKQTEVPKLPAGVGNLISLQTLDIRWCGKIEVLPNEVLNLVNLRHLKMFKNTGICGVILPEGIGRLRELLTLTGINVSGGIAIELGKLTQLRRLGVMDVAEDCVCDLLSSIMNMHALLSLSLHAKHTHNQGKLVLLESFSPPPFLRKLRLEGLLEKIPNWFGSLEMLTNLRLGFSHLSENPTLVLQLLPNLKTLTLWHAYDAKQIGKEFCNAGAFPKLEVLNIASHVLEEWTDLEEGALPSLKYLNLHNCLQLRMLPEGLQFITTLRQLRLLPLLDDHAERLKPDGGQENYKIRHIQQISFITMSTLRQKVMLNYTRSGVQIGSGEAEGEA